MTPTPDRDGQTPAVGEALILADGRRFVIAAVEGGARGWWFRATDQSGTRTLQGNLTLEWDAQSQAWRPAGVRSSRTPEPYQLAKHPPQIRRKQFD